MLKMICSWKDFLGFMVINFIQCKCLLINRANVFIRNVKSDLFYWTFHTWALSALKTYLGYLWFTSIFIKSGQDLMNRLVSSSSTFQSSYDFYIFFHFEVWVISWAHHIASLDQQQQQQQQQQSTTIFIIYTFSYN